MPEGLHLHLLSKLYLEGLDQISCVVLIDSVHSLHLLVLSAVEHTLHWRLSLRISSPMHQSRVGGLASLEVLLSRYVPDVDIIPLQDS